MTAHTGDCSTGCDNCGRICAEGGHEECIGTEAERAAGDANLADRGPFARCAKCRAEGDALAMFPGGICLSCYEQAPAARAPLTAEGIARMFRGSVNV